MNIQQYTELKNSEIDALNAIDIQYVNPKTLFKKTEFQDLTEAQCLTKAIELGWRWDVSKGKYFRIIGY